MVRGLGGGVSLESHDGFTIICVSAAIYICHLCAFLHGYLILGYGKPLISLAYLQSTINQLFKWLDVSCNPPGAVTDLVFLKAVRVPCPHKG